MRVYLDDLILISYIVVSPYVLSVVRWQYTDSEWFNTIVSPAQCKIG